MADFTLLIMDWYRQNKRDLPWRHTSDPYKIWLSEIILQQTKVEQGLSYYHKFIETYPKIEDLAEASEQDILNLWQGLGYYSRARNLHFTAKKIQNEYNGVFPFTYIEIITLKGIGSYTAAAIASFAFKEPVAVVDGNVYRLLSRVFDIDIAIDSTQGKKQFFELAQSLIDKKEPDIFNQAIMEFGALQCTPTNPNCEICPLNSICLSFAKGNIKLRPVKSKKLKVKVRYLNFLVFDDGENTFIEKRTKKDIWQNMYQYPLIESLSKEEDIDWSKYSKVSPDKISKEIIHILSHQKLHTRFYHFSHLSNFVEKDWILIKTSEIQDYPIPRLIDRYLQFTIDN